MRTRPSCAREPVGGRRWHGLRTRQHSPPRVFGHASCEREELSTSAQQAADWTRRCFLGGMTWAGTVSLLGRLPRWGAAESPPETATLKILNGPATCLVPQLMAEGLLPAEGVTDLRYVSPPPGPFTKAAASGAVDLTMSDARGVEPGPRRAARDPGRGPRPPNGRCAPSLRPPTSVHANPIGPHALGRASSILVPCPKYRRQTHGGGSLNLVDSSHA
jgi:hypothetical protein